MIPDAGGARTRLRHFASTTPVVRPAARALYHAWLALRRPWDRWHENRAFTVPAVTRRNSRRAYETLYGSAELLSEYLEPSRLRFYAEVAAVCAERPFRSILDAGSGSGHLLEAVAARVDAGVDLAGFDYARTGIEHARRLLPRARWAVGDIYDPPFDGPFDAVVCAEVLEHLRDPMRALTALHRCCGPRGRLIITVPDGERDDWEGHVNFWSAGELARLLDSFGTVEIRRIDEDRTLLAIVERP